ncbi:hypothetical protein B0I27_101180 [Arcticibacter pallidicorallinus]|uniref:Glycosyl hydrolase family 65 n=1 Tax=Arcticibacter pallidicorallinus TaxID=1259464 RepID=A0A2T0UBE2_9SPHI|nr:hypothetical protein [Arcticibacter pallidicorallinus]PRY55212.1 hypothetical protein B0I27_101180 [Arcticibacter pallidicorallinus]
MFKKVSLIFSAVFFASICAAQQPEKIDRYALVERNSPKITAISELSSLSVGNGNFAFTVDATGLQTFPELYSAGVPLGTQSQWGWHSFPNTHNYKPEETLKKYNFRGRDELYSVPVNEEGRHRDAAEYLRVNPHRMHLGYIGLEHANGRLRSEQISRIDQKLELWNGEIKSNFHIGGTPVTVRTAVHPKYDEVAATIGSSLLEKGKLSISFRFPYPSGKHADDASDWTLPEKHLTEVVSHRNGSLIFKRTVDTTVYYVTVRYKGKASLSEKEPHYFVLTPKSREFSFTSEFTEEVPVQIRGGAKETFTASSKYWQGFWTKGGVVDFSKCTDTRAKELERRVILSQYLLAIQSAGKYPPQETGLTYNSWFGKFHLEMHWWHSANFALWNHTDLLERSLGWYSQVAPVATEIARRQGFDGLRWMKMTDPSGIEAPSKVGSFLIWQQPHFIYMAELVYRNNPSPEVIRKYGELVNQTAEFMASFATYDEAKGRYLLKGAIAAQETLRASEVINPPFELSYWHYALSVAQQWKERAGEKRNAHWDELIAKLSPLAAADGLYLASEDAVDTYKDVRFTSDHPAILGALGILPQNRLINPDYMKNSLDWIWDNWNWPKTWGWDYPMTAMAAARLGDPEKAVGALLMDQQKNTYLVNGHNYQDARLRVYLPGNGGLLTAIAMMCAGWDGNETPNPGFPKDGKWNVRWENLQPMP